MQPPVLPIRGQYTASQINDDLIRDSPAIRFSAGCELLTGYDLMVAEDITDDLKGGSVSRAAYATLHGTAQLQIARELPWASALLRPYIVLSNGDISARFNLGAYSTDTPARQVWRKPLTYDVQCYDILNVVDDLVGDAYAVASGQSYVAAIESILVSRGIVRYYIDQERSDAVLPADKVWMFDDKTTWLTIVNDLAAAIGYAGAWSDWDGFIRVQKYIPVRDRHPEWTYDTGITTSMLGERSSHRDFFNAPNRWVFYRTNNLEGAAPVPGAGMYTYVNDYLGDTSVQSRERTITRVVGLDTADQPALEAAAQRVIDADSQIPTKIAAQTFRNPRHWHFDTLWIDDPEFGPGFMVQGSQWTLPLTGRGKMSHEWTVVGTG